MTAKLQITQSFQDIQPGFEEIIDYSQEKILFQFYYK